MMEVVPSIAERRVASVRAAMEELVKLFKKPKSRFYWFDFPYVANDIGDQPAKPKW